MKGLLFLVSPVIFLSNVTLPRATDAATRRTPLSDCRQCLVVTTPSWSASRGTMLVYERDNRSPWRQRGSLIPVRMGRAGLGWGRGLTSTRSLPGPIKIEGDDKAPAGVFRLSRAFGYAHEAPATKMPYLPLSETIVAVDDPGSRYYNQLIDESKVAKRDWQSREKMILTDNRYKWGVFIENNVPPRPGAGSCIFLHVWKNPGTATSGCTAMAQKNLLEIIRWLDPARHPLLIQLPEPIYNEWRAGWDLPAR